MLGLSTLQHLQMNDWLALQLPTFWLICITVNDLLCTGSNADMESSASLVTANISTRLCSIPAHTSSRHCFKSFASCALVWWTRCPRFCTRMDWGQGCSAATNLYVHSVDHDLLDYCTSKVEAASDAQNVTVDSQQNLSRMIMWYRNV